MNVRIPSYLVCHSFALITASSQLALTHVGVKPDDLCMFRLAPGEAEFLESGHHNDFGTRCYG